MKINKEEVLIVIACEEESNNLLEKLDLEILYTEIGKVNATYHLTKYLAEKKIKNKLPKYVINVGTVGSNKYKKGELVVCNQFIQRDMDCQEGKRRLGETPRDKFSFILEHKKIITDLPYAVCGTGDNFLPEQCPIEEVDVEDMEAYAFAKVCLFENIDFISIKYITNAMDDTANSDWDNSVISSANSFYNYFKKILA